MPFFLALILALLLTVPGLAAQAPWSKVGGKCYNGKGELIPGAITRGVDVSTWDGLINWERVAATGTIDFAFVRLMHGTKIMDNRFDRNMTQAAANGIPVGVYVYSAAQTYQEILEEAQKTIRMIDGYLVSYPVALDLEDPSLETLPKQKIGKMARIFCDEIRRAGYTPMIYCNQYWYDTMVDWSGLEDVDIWLARFKDDLTGPDKSRYRYTIWQATAGAVGTNLPTRNLIPGFTDGDMDINFGYVDYTKKIIPRRNTIGSYTPTGQDAYPEDGWVFSGSKWYYYLQGKPATGWTKIDGKTYLFSGKGVLRTKVLVRTGAGKVFYVGGDGARVTNQFATLGGKTYYFGKNGAAVKGKKTIDGLRYYFDKEDATMYKNRKVIDESGIYYATEDGTLAMGKFVKIVEEGLENTYYFGKNSRAYVGMHRIGGRIYTFGEVGTLRGVLLDIGRADEYEQISVEDVA